jgi:putative ABC transport system ATP-binding protein
VEIDNVSQTFGEGELAVQALKPTSLSVDAGELVALLGPSGSGKSTLLLAISLIQPPTTGRIVIDGQTLYDGGPTRVDARAFRRGTIGFIFQQHNLIPFLTALENVSLMLQLNGVGRRESTRRARDVLAYLRSARRFAQRSCSASSSASRSRALANGWC